MKAPEPQMRFLAEKALWYADKQLASKEAGWQTFESIRWGFVAITECFTKSKERVSAKSRINWL